MNKVLLITEALYPGYLLIFLFDNITSHLVYTKDILHIREINRNLKKKQSYLHND